MTIRRLSAKISACILLILGCINSIKALEPDGARRLQQTLLALQSIDTIQHMLANIPARLSPLLDSILKKYLETQASKPEMAVILLDHFRTLLVGKNLKDRDGAIYDLQDFILAARDLLEASGTTLDQDKVTTATNLVVGLTETISIFEMLLMHAITMTKRTPKPDSDDTKSKKDQDTETTDLVLSQTTTPSSVPAEPITANTKLSLELRTNFADAIRILGLVPDEKITIGNILGTPQDASSEALKTAFKQSALKWHPDKNKDNVEQAERVMMLINAINSEYLSNLASTTPTQPAEQPSDKPILALEGPMIPKKETIISPEIKEGMDKIKQKILAFFKKLNDQKPSQIIGAAQTITNTSLIVLNGAAFTPAYNQELAALGLDPISYGTTFGLVPFVQNLESFTKLAKKNLPEALQKMRCLISKKVSCSGACEDKNIARCLKDVWDTNLSSLVTTVMRPLIGDIDPTNPDRRIIVGIPLLLSSTINLLYPGIEEAIQKSKEGIESIESKEGKLLILARDAALQLLELRMLIEQTLEFITSAGSSSKQQDLEQAIDQTEFQEAYENATHYVNL
ncbi:J domain-containing protein [Candidatus Dependentiae bacterium]|nr:J domain-containing protein [Candidatus Dependentiae bacterium]